MFKNLSPGDIGIRDLSLSRAIELAQKTGFGGINFSIREAAQLADEHGVDYVRNLFESAGVELIEDGGSRNRSQQTTKVDLQPGEVRKLKIVAGKEGAPLSIRFD